MASPYYWAFEAQRRVRHPQRRAKIARWLAGRRTRSVVMPGGNAAATVQALVQDMNRQGYHLLTGLVEPQQVAEMRAYFSEQKARDPYRPTFGQFMPLTEARPETHVAFFDAETVVAAPHAVALANHPLLLASIEALLGCKPSIGYLTAWWSLPGDGTAEHAERFHRDVDDWAFYKFFLYLTDVDEHSGPHVYIPGSHDRATHLDLRRYTDAEAAALGRELRFTGPAGSCFVENTFGMHRGLPPRDRPRLIFQVTYCLMGLPYAPAKPVAPLPPGFDPFINRFYFKESS
ncbi:hypothetical protein VZ95_10520 [Elstera litoralis]|uniref:Phytanoyl-CoA dioxygenase n=2 Tax=Elstera litoralis TaxID=552518 RepID=A0A0F3ISJ8_9PROT|nr:hypothetical protein VZ95_10520 [Elstera litoralis]